MIRVEQTVGEILAERPALSLVFEKVGIDYCCGGKQSLADACKGRGLDPETVRVMLEAMEATSKGASTAVDVAGLTLSDLADHIERTHHAYLKEELPRLDAWTTKVASVHGAEEPRLHEVRRTFMALQEEMAAHMMKEERILFPMIRQLEASAAAPSFCCGSLAAPIAQMELEHDEAGAALHKFRDLTGGYVPPEHACKTYRAMLQSLARLEQDMHQHVHKENNVLFPRTLKMEKEKARTR
ncbi:MAG: iron-sulfur cluster repair di-iron protein [Planctomycetes bacterium]|nr:iron-sulfur cluster repair di-iron protein [Planctomycetota bacterium]